ncbi:single-stranded DNA-binding protein [Spongiactinospora sp. TRM90649]|uniref:single-stranded DNA-binding protein n=1 Tax=Spongiactinospora sp. TRM90649 TaxID=3031114 RepID=UPI0023F8F9FA|nr:single-stranded DNA-binding protein [Spongiactinospora sp. TRM90649]MDF5758705.1 single-stranded DNA-binding protein [Spongiactinospora sp. TRM90649]
MNDIQLTLNGHVVADPRQHTFPDGSRVTSLRVCSTSRYYDRKAGEWRDGEKIFFAVRCWRGLADNVAQSVRVGQPVVVQGRLRIREFGPEGERRFLAEVEATSVGHDLRWGIGTFTKPQRLGATPALDQETRDSLDRSTEDWAFATTRPPRPALPPTSSAHPTPPQALPPLPTPTPPSPVAPHPPTPPSPPEPAPASWSPGPQATAAVPHPCAPTPLSEAAPTSWSPGAQAAVDVPPSDGVSGDAATEPPERSRGLRPLSALLAEVVIPSSATTSDAHGEEALEPVEQVAPRGRRSTTKGRRAGSPGTATRQPSADEPMVA